MADLPVFPTTVRLATDYSETLDLGVIRSDMDGGLAKQRPCFSVPIHTRQVTLVAPSTAAKLAFDRWFVQDLKGAGWFVYRDPLRHGASTTVRFKETLIAWRQRGNQCWDAHVTLESLADERIHSPKG